MVGVIIQARMSSTRLPGKVLKRILGKPLLAWEIERVNNAHEIDSIVIATTTNRADKKIVDFAIRNNIYYFRGKETDVLDRYYECSKKFNIDTIVRITADCPLIDPHIIDSVIRYYKKGTFDYVTCGINSTFPDGMDVEVFSQDVLKKAWENTTLPSEREHVTAYIWKHPEKFKIGIFKGEIDYSYLRLTVDEKEDFILVKNLLTALYPKKQNFSLDDIVSFLKKNKALARINSKFMRNEGYIKSIRGEALRVGRLIGKRIYLRDLTVRDATRRYCRWLNDPEVNKYLETKGATVGELKKYIQAKVYDPHVIFLGIFTKITKKHIGNIKLEPVDFKNKTAELGLLIGDRNYWGKGYAAEAINLICNFAFDALGLQSITLGVYLAHTSAIKAYEKAGFTFHAKKKGVDGIVMKRDRDST